MTKIPLVLLPGTLCDAQLWTHQITHLSDIADIQVGNMTGASTIVEIAKMVLDNSPHRFALAGLSLGGIVAIEILRQAPERVIKLSLIGTTANPPYPEQLEAWNELIHMTKNGEFSRVVYEKFLPNLLYEFHPMKENLVSTILSMAENVGETAYINQLKAVANKSNGFEVLPNILCETLLIVGEEDSLCTVEMHKGMQKEIPYTNLVVLEKCGHLSPIEQPTLVTAAMRKWLLGETSYKKSSCKSCGNCLNQVRESI